MNLFFDEFGEEAFSFDGGDVTAVVAPDEDAAFDVEEEQSRGCPCHGCDRIPDSNQINATVNTERRRRRKTGIQRRRCHTSN